MDIQDNRPSDETPPDRYAKIGPITKLLLKIAGVDEATLRRCPQQDVGAITAVTWLLIATGIYSATIFSIIAHMLFAQPGQIEPGLIAGSAAVAAFIIAIDSYVFLRCSWFESGVQELMRAGLDISGGARLATSIKNNIFLGVRLALSGGLAMLTGVFIAIIVFFADINARIDKTYQFDNRVLFHDSTSIADADIQRTTDAVSAQTAQVAALSGQITSLRQNEISSQDSAPETQQPQQEINQLLSEKTKAEDDARKAESFASRELGGYGGDDHSGHAGNGPKYRAALEDAANAKHHAQEVDGALNAARGRLDTLRAKLSSTNEATKQRSQQQLPKFEADLDNENGKLTMLKDKLSTLTQGRNDAIRSMVDHSPNHVPHNSGFLAQIIALEQIANEDAKVASVILLFELVSIGFELAAVLAKTMAYCPTTYSALIARDHYLRIVHIVDGMMTKIGERPSEEEQTPETGTPNMPPPANDNEQGGGQGEMPGPFEEQDEPAQSPPPRRGRGRPRKPRHLH